MESACLQCAFISLAGSPETMKTDKKKVNGKNRIPYWIDRRLTDLAGLEYHANISFGLPIEPDDSQFGKSWVRTGIYHDLPFDLFTSSSP